MCAVVAPRGRFLRCRLRVTVPHGLVIRTRYERPSFISCTDHLHDPMWEQIFLRRLPIDLLKESVFEGWPIEVHTIFPHLLTERAEVLGFESVEALHFNIEGCDEKYRFLTPKYFKVSREGVIRVIVAVSPGRDSAYYHADILSRYLDKIARSASMVGIVRHIDLEEKIADWTRLDGRFISPSDHVVIGFADEVCNLIKGQVDCRFIGKYEDSYFSSRRYRLANGEVVNFLEVNLDFIGSIGAKLVQKIARMGAAHIIFCGRLHGVGRMKDCYGQIFCPSRYIYHEANGQVRYVMRAPNFINALFPSANTGWHLTVSPLPQLDSMSTIPQLGQVNSVDTELGAMAAAIEDVNYERGTQTGFSPIQFAPDILAHALQNRPFLSIDREKRLYALRLIANFLARFLNRI